MRTTIRSLIYYSRPTSALHLHLNLHLLHSPNHIFPSYSALPVTQTSYWRHILWRIIFPHQISPRCICNGWTGGFMRLSNKMRRINGMSTTRLSGASSAPFLTCSPLNSSEVSEMARIVPFSVYPHRWSGAYSGELLRRRNAPLTCALVVSWVSFPLFLDFWHCAYASMLHGRTSAVFFSR